MPNFLDSLNEIFGFGSFGLGSVENLVIWFVIVVFIVILAGVILYFYMMGKVYRHRIEVYKKMGNTPMLVGKYRAREVPVGRAGDRVMYVAKLKRYLPMPTIQAGRNLWWFWDREDGEFINVGLEDIDLTMKKMNVKFVDADMRMQRLGIEKNLKYRLDKPNLLREYLPYIVNAVFYILVTLMLIVLFVQWRKTALALDTTIDKADAIIGKVCGIQKPTEPEGSGIIPALFLLLQGNYYYIMAKLKKREKWIG